MPPPKKDEPGYAEYREQYALCDQSQLVDYSTVVITPPSSHLSNLPGAADLAPANQIFRLGPKAESHLRVVRPCVVL